MRSKLLNIFIFFITITALSQERQTIPGKIMSGDNGVEGVFVINKTAGTEVKTDYKGNFDLTAKIGDKIIVYSTKTIVREFTLNADSFKVSPYVISVNFKATELDEVVINKYNNVDVESLGIVPKGQKQRTVAERRVYTAGTFTLGTVISVDPIINAITGRTKMLKKALETERQEGSISLLQGLYTDNEIMTNYNIPQEQVGGFIYYLAENKEFAAAMKSKNKTYLDFLMAELSKKYLKLQQDGK